jgi:hypothetical protein
LPELGMPQCECLAKVNVTDRHFAGDQIQLAPTSFRNSARFAGSIDSTALGAVNSSVSLDDRAGVAGVVRCAVRVGRLFCCWRCAIA